MPYIICSQDSHQVYCDIKPLCLEPALVAIFQHPLHDMKVSHDPTLRALQICLLLWEQFLFMQI